MAKPPTSVAHIPNRLLARLPAGERARLLPLLQPVTLKFKQVLYKARGLIDWVYFPTGGVVSAVAAKPDEGTNGSREASRKLIAPARIFPANSGTESQARPTNSGRTRWSPRITSVESPMRAARSTRRSSARNHAG